MKHFKKRYRNKSISLVIALLLLITALPLNVFAVGEADLGLVDLPIETAEIPQDEVTNPPILPIEETPEEVLPVEPEMVTPKMVVIFEGFEEFPSDLEFIPIVVALSANDTVIEKAEVNLNETELLFNEQPVLDEDKNEILYEFVLYVNMNNNVEVKIIGMNIYVKYIRPEVEEPVADEKPAEGEITEPSTGELNGEAPQEELEGDFDFSKAENPDNLDGPIYVEGSGLNYLPGSLSTASMGTRFLAEKSPTVPGGVELIKIVEEIDGLLNTFKVTLRVEALDEQKI